MTGLIYVVIIALWAAVLIPVWLRRHDQISEVRSTARFSSAMRSLGGQGQVQYATDSYALESRAVDVSLPPTHRPGSEARMTRPTNARPAEGLDPSYERELVRQAAATRRSIVLGALTVILLVTLVLAIASIVPRWAPILAAVPVVAFVLATSMTASARSSRRVRPPGADVDPYRLRARRRRTDAAPAAQADDDWETWNAWDDEDSWEAVPQTLPDLRHRSARLRGAAWHRPVAAGRVDRHRHGRDGAGHAQPTALGAAGRSVRDRPRCEHRGDPGRRRVVGPAPRRQRVGVSRPPAATCYPFLRTTTGL